jgi:hypothetical protein
MTDLELNVAVAKALGLKHSCDGNVCMAGLCSEPFTPAETWNWAMWAAEKAFGKDAHFGVYKDGPIWSAVISNLSAKGITGPRAICALIHENGKSRVTEGTVVGSQETPQTWIDERTANVETVKATSDGPLLPSRLVKWDGYDAQHNLDSKMPTAAQMVAFYNIKDTPLTESRVREIVREELATRGTGTITKPCSICGILAKFNINDPDTHCNVCEDEKVSVPVADALIKGDGLYRGPATVQVQPPMPVAPDAPSEPLSVTIDRLYSEIVGDGINPAAFSRVMERLTDKAGEKTWTQFPPDGIVINNPGNQTVYLGVGLQNQGSTAESLKAYTPEVFEKAKELNDAIASGMVKLPAGSGAAAAMEWRERVKGPPSHEMCDLAEQMTEQMKRDFDEATSRYIYGDENDPASHDYALKKMREAFAGTELGDDLSKITGPLVNETTYAPVDPPNPFAGFFSSPATE